MKPQSKIFISAGEASSDLIVSKILPLLAGKNILLEGIGGKECEKAGLNILLNSEHLSIVGVSDWVGRLPEVYRHYRKIKNRVLQTNYDLALLCDLPDFNLKLAQSFSKTKTPIVYFISPQIWAWRKSRISKIKKLISKMLVILPFEENFYKKHGIEAEYVGHPLTEILKVRKNYRTQEEILRNPRIAILPGSRKSEIKYHAAILEKVIEKIEYKFPNAEINIPLASTLEENFVKNYFKYKSKYLTTQSSHQIIEWADVAAIASGTATLETAYIGTPFCLFYKMSPLTEWGIRNIIGYKKFFGMPNLILEREAFSEFCLAKATPENIFKELINLIENPNERQKKIESIFECRKKLSHADSKVAQKVANEILEFIKTRA